MLKYCVFFMFMVSTLFAQQVRVVDAHTGEEIKQVVLTKTDQTYYTKKLNHKRTSKTITNLVFYTVSSPNYKRKKVSEKELKKEIRLEPKYEALESLVMSVSRSAEKKKLIPEQIEVVTKDYSNYIAPQTSADLLANTNGVRVQKSQLGGGSPTIRGLEANRVLLVVDGVRLNNAIYRSGHLQNSITISPFATERTEVVFGPTSVTYGSDALGGVIHYYTKQLNYNTSRIHKNNSFYRHSTVNNEHSAGYSLYISDKKLASYTNISFSSFGDLKMGENRIHGYEDWGKVFEYSKNTESNYYENSSTNNDSSVQKNTAYKQVDLLQKFMLPINDDIDFILNTQFSTTNGIPNFGKLNDLNDDGSLKFAEWRYGPQQRLLISSKLKFHDNPSFLFENGAFVFAYQNILESRINRRFGSLDRISRNEKVNVFSLNGDFYKALNQKGNRKLHYGVELVHNNVGSKGIGEILSVDENKIIGIQDIHRVDTRYPNAGSTYTSAALYASYRQRLNKKEVLSTGIRLTNTLLKANWQEGVSIPIPDNSISLKNYALTGSIGYINNFTKTQRINILLSKGFRSPNVDDIGKIRSKSGKLTVPNTELKPEHLYSIEFGYNKDSKKFKLDARAYYTLLKDYISRFSSDEFGDVLEFDGDEFEDENIIANTNIGLAYIYGSTLSGLLEVLPNVKAKASVTYTKGALYEDNQPLSSIPPLFGNASLGFFKEKYNIALVYRFSFAKELEDYNLVEGIDNLDETPNNLGTPSWYTIGLNSNYYIAENLRLQLQLQNILDVHYKEFASSLSAPGRNFVASLAYSF